MSQAASPSRIAWVDNLRTLMIVLVVNLHACVTYSHVGGWYRMEVPEPAMLVKIAFVFWQGHLQAFFMGFLFFLAGVFAHPSLERRGATAFLRERGRRLGLPSLLYMLLIHPFVVYVVARFAEHSLTLQRCDLAAKLVLSPGDTSSPSDTASWRMLRGDHPGFIRRGIAGGSSDRPGPD